MNETPMNNNGVLGTVATSVWNLVNTVSGGAKKSVSSMVGAGVVVPKSVTPSVKKTRMKKRMDFQQVDHDKRVQERKTKTSHEDAKPLKLGEKRCRVEQDVEHEASSKKIKQESTVYPSTSVVLPDVLKKYGFVHLPVEVGSAYLFENITNVVNFSILKGRRNDQSGLWSTSSVMKYMESQLRLMAQHYTSSSKEEQCKMIKALQDYIDVPAITFATLDGGYNVFFKEPLEIIGAHISGSQYDKKIRERVLIGFASLIFGEPITYKKLRKYQGEICPLGDFNPEAPKAQVVYSFFKDLLACTDQNMKQEQHGGCGARNFNVIVRGDDFMQYCDNAFYKEDLVLVRRHLEKMHAEEHAHYKECKALYDKIG